MIFQPLGIITKVETHFGLEEKASSAGGAFFAFDFGKAGTLECQLLAFEPRRAFVLHMDMSKLREGYFVKVTNCLV